MDLELKGKRALVTAASQGLGKAIATELSREGSQVAIASRDSGRIRAAAEAIQAETGQRVTPFVADVANPDDISDMVARTVQELGGIDILVTNAGGPPTGAFVALSDAQWQTAFNLTLMSVVRIIREVMPIMSAQGGGRILHVSSMVVKEPIPDMMLSNTLRTGVMAMLKSLAYETAKDHILIHSLAPGRIDTERIRALDSQRASKEGREVAAVRDEQTAKIPLGRYGTPEEFGRLAAFLLSPKNSYMTGETLFVDGGYLRAY